MDEFRYIFNNTYGLQGGLFEQPHSERVDTTTNTIFRIVDGFDVPFDFAILPGTYRVLVTNSGDDRLRVIQ